MEIKKNQSTEQRPSGERLVNAEIVAIDLPYYKAEIRKESAWLKGPRNAITVFKSDQMRIVLIALHAEAELPWHTADGTISVQVLEGSIRFSIDSHIVDMETGQMVTLHRNIPHQVYAKEEAMFLLTLAPTPKAQREHPEAPL